MKQALILAAILLAVLTIAGCSSHAAQTAPDPHAFNQQEWTAHWNQMLVDFADDIGEIQYDYPAWTRQVNSKHYRLEDDDKWLTAHQGDGMDGLQRAVDLLAFAVECRAGIELDTLRYRNGIGEKPDATEVNNCFKYGKVRP